MSGEYGIKETIELEVGAYKLGRLLYKSFADGVQAHDFAELFSKISGDEALKKALLDAYNGADQVPKELKDLDLGEGLQLATALLTEVMKPE